MTEWNSVSDRLPDVGVPVLAIVTGYWLAGAHMQGPIEMFHREIQIVRLVPGLGWRTHGYEWRVTHWLPLPPLPESEP